MIPIVILVSGNGSNFQAIYEKCHGRSVQIKAVISDQVDAYGLVLAREAEIPHFVCSHVKGEFRENYCEILADVIEDVAGDVALVVLAGFMQILSPNFIQRFKNKILNIHPSLLPRYRGLDTHRRVLEAGDEYHGATVHVVTEELDNGPILAQDHFRVRSNDNVRTLEGYVHNLEHKLYPGVLTVLGQNQVIMTRPSVYEDEGEFESKPFSVDPKYFINDT